MSSNLAEARSVFERRMRLAYNLTGLALYAIASGNLLKALSDPLHPLHLNAGLLRNGADFALHALSQIIPGSQTESGYKGDLKYLDFLLVGGFLFLGARYLIKEWKDYVALTKEMGLGRFLGREPVPKHINPSIVIFSQSDEVLSDLVNQARSKRRIKDTKKAPVVGILLGNGIPSVLGEGQMSYYIQAEISDLGSKPSSTKRSKHLREASGSFRAKELLFIGLDRFSGMFPKYERGLFLDTQHIWSELVDICDANPESLRGKRITIIMSKKQKLNQIGFDEKEFKRMATKYDFKLEIITPEEIFIKKVVRKLQRIEENKAAKEKIKVVVVEHEHTLESMKEKNGSLLTQSLKDIGSLIENLSVHRIVVDEGFLSTSIDGEESNRVDTGDLIASADLIILTGQSDRGIINTVESMISNNKKISESPLDPKKITIVVDNIETARLLKKKYKIDVFVPMSEVITKFSIGKHTTSK